MAIATFPYTEHGEDIRAICRVIRGIARVPFSIANSREDSSATECAYCALCRTCAAIADSNATYATFEIRAIVTCELRNAVDARAMRAHDANGKPVLGAHYAGSECT
jgi:hypothetical protein